MRGKRPYSYRFVVWCFQNLFKTVCDILVWFPSSFFSMCFVCVHAVHLYSTIVTVTTWKKSQFSLSKSDFHMIDNPSIAFYSDVRRILISLSVGEILLPRYLSLSTYFRSLPLQKEMAPSSYLKHIYSVLLVFTYRLILPVACSRLCSRDSAWAGAFKKSSISSA